MLSKEEEKKLLEKAGDAHAENVAMITVLARELVLKARDLKVPVAFCVNSLPIGYEYIGGQCLTNIDLLSAQMLLQACLGEIIEAKPFG